MFVASVFKPSVIWLTRFYIPTLVTKRESAKLPTHLTFCLANNFFVIVIGITIHDLYARIRGYLPRYRTDVKIFCHTNYFLRVFLAGA